MSDVPFLVEPARELPVVRSADVVVCGAGPAGVAAALAAVSCGANTVLIETSGCLGDV
ncbi:MAG: FAD-dependent oxidoreductase [Chthoniobacterales bacterium]|nr:FAD-dependent oxidoreductase [Chthoniobacterales bacterium]